MTPHRQKYFRYRGMSMWPGFQEGDLLEIEAVAAEQIKVGDCLLFPDPDGQLVVHRLVDKRNGLRTRGDATSRPDPFAVLPEQVLGRIIRRHRLDRTTAVKGGWHGKLLAIFYRYAGRIDPDRQSRGGRLARAIQGLSTTLLMPLWRRSRVKALKISEQGSMVVWLVGNNVLGRREPASGRWVIRWPWRILVKEPIEAEPAKRA